MAKSGTIMMSMREADRLKTIQAVVDGHLRPGLAAQRLELTALQVRRLVQRYCAEGPAGLVSRHRGRSSNHQLPKELVNRAVRLLRDHYPDFGPIRLREAARATWRSAVQGNGTATDD